jgi:hypothetical protein
VAIPNPWVDNYALLSLSPLSAASFGRSLGRLLLARLACLIHAANVHSEPGSNPSIGYIHQLPAACAGEKLKSLFEVLEIRFTPPLAGRRELRSLYDLALALETAATKSRALESQKRSLTKLSKSKLVFLPCSVQRQGLEPFLARIDARPPAISTKLSGQEVIITMSRSKASLERNLVRLFSRPSTAANRCFRRDP